VRTLFSGFPGDQMVTTRAKEYPLDLLDKKKYKAYLLAPKRFSSQFNKIKPFIPGGLIYSLQSMADSVGYYKKTTRIAGEIFNIPAYYKAKYKEVFWQDPVFRELYNSYRHSQKYSLLKPQVSQRMEGENRFGLYFKLETRFPMADIRLTQFFSAMPNELKYGEEMSRPSYRAAMKNYLPPQILARDSKSGSIAPFTGLNKEKREKMMDVLVNELPDTPLIKKQALLKRHIENKQNTGDANNKANKILHSLQVYSLTLRWLADKNNLELLNSSI